MQLKLWRLKKQDVFKNCKCPKSKIRLMEEVIVLQLTLVIKEDVYLLVSGSKMI